MSDMFDFGFTAVDEDGLFDLGGLRSKNSERENELSELRFKVQEVHSLINDLLSNLSKNPEKEYIYWPNRKEKIEAFRERINNILKE